MKTIKGLEEQLSSERDRHRQVEKKVSELNSKLNNLSNEVKSLGKRKVSLAPCNWHEWESGSDSASAEQLPSNNTRK